MGEMCYVNYDRRHGIGPFFGRLFISIIFIISGLGKIAFFQETANLLRGMGIPGPQTFTVIALLFELVGGILLLLGWYTRFAVYLLMIFLIVTTFLMHRFWEYSGHDMQTQMANFLKNLAIFGGLMLLYSYGPGRWSLDSKRCEKEARKP